jgi:hypothetical protein
MILKSAHINNTWGLFKALSCPMVLKLWRASESPAGLIIARLLGPDPKDSDLADMPQGLGIHISSKFSGGAETAGVWTPTWEPVTRDSPSQFSCVLYIKHRYK